MRNKKNIIIAVMICVAVLMATGYAYFATRLNINATGNITSNWNVYFSNISSGTKVGSASNAKTPSVTGTSATMDVNLSLPGDSMTYELTLMNGGSIGAIIEDIEINAVGSSAITYEVSGLEIGDKLASGASKVLTIKIEYDVNTTGQPSELSKTLTITIDAVQDIGQNISGGTGSEEESICTLSSNSKKGAGEVGAKYDCKVDPNKPDYTFYLLDNNADGTSNLIMNANINASGEAVIPGVTSDTGLVAWYTDERNNINGPVTAMTYLHNATKSWTKVPPVNYEYYDREFHGISHEGVGYVSFISINGVGVITKGNAERTQVTIGSSTEPLRSRMPIFSVEYYEDNDELINEKGDLNTMNAFIFDNLDTDMEYHPAGYWTLSSESTYYEYNDLNGCAWVFGWDEYIGNDSVNKSSSYGVRPVITVKL